MTQFFILIAIVMLSFPALAEEGKVVARVQQGIYEVPIQWHEEMQLCKSDAVLKSAAEFLEMEVADLRKRISLEGLVEGTELAITVQHEDAAKAETLAGMIRADFERARIEYEVGLLKKAHALEIQEKELTIRRMKLNLDYSRATAETQERVLRSVSALVENAESVENLVTKEYEDERMRSATEAFQRRFRIWDQDEAALRAKVRAMRHPRPVRKVIVGPTLEEDRMTYGKAKAALEEEEGE